jgi:hypothetical protein
MLIRRVTSCIEVERTRPYVSRAAREETANVA